MNYRNPHANMAIKGLEQMRGDDLARAERQFRDCTPQQMKQQWGQSGKTCQEVLDEYRAHATKINQAIEWVAAHALQAAE